MSLSNLDRDWALCEPKVLEDYERKIRFDLPKDYRDFLLEQNGGISKIALLFPLKQGSKVIEEGLHTLYGINAPEIRSLSDRFDIYHIHQRRMPDYLIPIGSDRSGNQICMLLNNRSFGYILFWDHESEVDFENPEEAINPLRNCTLIAKSFSEFASMLK